MDIFKELHKYSCIDGFSKLDEFEQHKFTLFYKCDECKRALTVKEYDNCSVYKDDEGIKFRTCQQCVVKKDSKAPLKTSEHCAYCRNSLNVIKMPFDVISLHIDCYEKLVLRGVYGNV